MKEPGWDHRVPSGLFAARSAVPLRVGLRPGPLEDETQEGLHRGGLLLIPAIGHIDGALVEAVLQVKELHLAVVQHIRFGHDGDSEAAGHQRGDAGLSGGIAEYLRRPAALGDVRHDIPVDLDMGHIGVIKG